MTDLTEQWKKGELKEGWYYVKKVNGQQDIAECYRLIDVMTNVSSTVFEFSEDIEQVLAPVPSYDEWVYLHKARNDAHEIVESLTQENTQLKELLKECKNYTQIMVDAANLRHLERHEDTAYNDGKDILAKINQALGEDK